MQISLRTVDLCLGMLQDFLFDNICDQLGIEEYSGIKTVLLDIRAIRELPAFRFELQVILSFLYMEESSLKQELILDQTLVTNQLIPKLSSLMDATELKMLLNKLKALSNIAENRQLFRNSRMLLCLGTLMEHFTNNSVVEASIAELIHVVLSDAPDTESDVAEEGEKVNAIAMFEEFMTYSYDGELVVCYFHYIE